MKLIFLMVLILSTLFANTFYEKITDLIDMDLRYVTKKQCDKMNGTYKVFKRENNGFPFKVYICESYK